MAFYPTDDVIADYFTNPLRGKQFNKLRKIIRSIKENDCFEK